MSKGKRGSPVKAKPLTIEQNIAVDPPETMKRGDAYSGTIEAGRPDDVVRDPIKETEFAVRVEVPPATYKDGKEVAEIPVATTPRDTCIFKIKALTRDIEGLEPQSKAWYDMLEEIGDLKRKLDKL